MEYADERKYNLFERIAVSLIFAFVWYIVGTGNMSLFDEIVMAFIMVFCAEYSYEYYGGKLHIRSAGKRWLLTGFVKWLVWPIMWPLHTFFGVRNFPALAALLTAFYVYGWSIGYQFLDQFVHVCLLWYLYHMRKVDK